LKTSPIEQSIDPAVTLPPFRSVEELRAHPRFAEAVALLVDGLTAGCGR
jgi:hypothetical protein